MSAHSGTDHVGYKVIVDGLSESPTDGIRDHLKVVEQPFPNVDALAAHDVVIAVRCAGLSWVDLLMLSGQYQHMPNLPYTPGLEYSGTIAWAGPDVDRKMFDVGQSVFVDCFSVGPRTSGPYQAYGGMASYAVAPASAVRAMPSQFTFEQACNYAGNYETAYHCLVACGQLRAGETVLVHGASGATGVAAVQIAKHLGAKVIATGRSLHKLEVIKSLGADHIVPIGHEDGRPGVRRFRDDIEALTGGVGVDVVYDGVGGDVDRKPSLCPIGEIYRGWASTPDVAKGKGGRGAPRANQLPTNLILMKGLKVLGCPTVIATQHEPTIRDERVATLMGGCAGALRPHVSHQFNIHDVAEAFQTKWRGDVIGGCIITPRQLPMLTKNEEPCAGLDMVCIWTNMHTLGRCRLHGRLGGGAKLRTMWSLNQRVFNESIQAVEHPVGRLKGHALTILPYVADRVSPVRLMRGRTYPIRVSMTSAVRSPSLERCSPVTS